MEKYRPWERHTKDNEINARRKLDSLSPRKINNSSMTSDSGPWLPTPTEYEYRSKIFDDPRNLSSNKENALPPLESVTIPTFKITEEEFLERTEKLLGKEDSKWEAHVAQQIPLPRASSPYPDDRQETLEQLELETDKDIDITDYMRDLPITGDHPNPNMALV